MQRDERVARARESHICSTASRKHIFFARLHYFLLLLFLLATLAQPCHQSLAPQPLIRYAARHCR
jgi:ATP/ADP translocase